MQLLDLRRPRLALLLLCLALWLPGFFTIPAGDRDEARFAQASKQMLETGDYVRIMNGDEARNRKPIGIHWLQLPFAAWAHGAELATENPIWPYRIPSLLGAIAAVLATFSLGLRLFGQRAALLGAAFLASTVLLTVETHIAKTDAALLGATTVAMALLAHAYLAPAAFARRHAAGFWLAMGAGIMLKGPITPMVAGLAVVALLVAGRRAAWLRVLRPAWGLPLMLLVVVPWFAAIGVATQGRFFADAVGGDLGRKLTSGDDAHWGPPGLHLLLLPVLLFPATAALPAAASLAWRERRTDPVRFLLAWIVPAWLVFEATPTKLPHYPLPLYPAIALLLAQGLLQAAARPSRPWLLAGAGLAAVVGLALGAAALAAPPLLHMAPWDATATVALGLPAALAALLAAWCAARATRPRLAIAAPLAAIPLYAALLGWELPRLWPLWLAPRVVAAETLNAMPGPLGAIGYAEPSLMFLAGTRTEFLRPADAIPALRSGEVGTLLVGDRDLASVLAAAEAAGIPLHRRAVIPGFNYSRGRTVSLTLLTR